MPKKDEKSEVKMTADEIRHRLRKSFGPAGLDPSALDVLAGASVSATD